jgi:uncharacterized membrane protein YgdD (TMEM256/DUF423 family)
MLNGLAESGGEELWIEGRQAWESPHTLPPQSILPMNPRHWIVLGALLGAAGVGLGAFGAHGLEEFLRNREGLPAKDAGDEPASQTQDALSAATAQVEKHLQNWDTAVRYHLIHACALVLIGILGWHAHVFVGVSSSANTPTTTWAWHPALGWLAAAGWLLAAGIVLFCGLLYVMVLGGPRWLGAIVPIGGLSLIAGWLAVALSATRKNP